LKILFLPKYDTEGSSSRYRTYNYLPYFNTENNFIVKPLLYNGYVKDLHRQNVFILKIIRIFWCIISRILYVLFNKNKFDVLIIEKELIPYLPFLIERIILWKTKYSLDFDDADFLKYEKYKLLNDKVHLLSQNSLFTTVGNSWYFDFIKSDKLVYLPTVLDIYNYKMKMKIDNPPVIRIVWIGSFSTLKYLELVREPLRILSKSYNLELRIIGGHFDDDIINCESLAWNSDNEAQLINESDIGIMPQNDSSWEKGKCGFKLVQYMACGLPVIASPSPANNEIITQGINGFIAINQKDWIIYLKELITNLNLRKNIGKANREKIKEKYSYQIWGPKYVELVNSKLYKHSD